MVVGWLVTKLSLLEGLFRRGWNRMGWDDRISFRDLVG